MVFLLPEFRWLVPIRQHRHNNHKYHHWPLMKGLEKVWTLAGHNKIFQWDKRMSLAHHSRPENSRNDRDYKKLEKYILDIRFRLWIYTPQFRCFLYWKFQIKDIRWHFSKDFGNPIGWTSSIFIKNENTSLTKFSPYFQEQNQNSY